MKLDKMVLIIIFFFFFFFVCLFVVDLLIICSIFIISNKVKLNLQTSNLVINLSCNK